MEHLFEGMTGVLVLFILAVFAILYFWSIYWAYNDAEARGKSGVIVALLVALCSWPTSILIWLAFRPRE